MAGFEVIIYGRFWVITEAVSRESGQRAVRSRLRLDFDRALRRKSIFANLLRVSDQGEALS
jgi:hypothetical protein